MRKSIQSFMFFLLVFAFLSYDNPNLPPVYLPEGYHVIKSLSATGNTCQLENGSVWEVCPSDREILFTWSVTDPLTIYPHWGWFSSYDFEIKNEATNSRILANLQFLSEEEYSCRITHLDIDQGVVFLQDGTRWLLDLSDASIYSKWGLSDAIIIGSNKSGFFSKDSHILINADKKNYVRGSQE